PAIPDKEGFAGMYAGVSNGVLIGAGGANFPDKKPWEGGEKVWYDHIYYLEDRESEWKLADQKLLRPIGYGVSLSYQDQVLIIGGSDAEGHIDQVYALRFDREAVLIDEDFPDLPIPLANMAGALVDGVIYLVGGQRTPTGLAEDAFLMLDLKQPKALRQWERGPDFPGQSRIQAVAASHEGAFYLFSGFHLTPGEAGGTERTLLTDAFRFNPSSGTWEKLPDLPHGAAAAPSPAMSVGRNHIIISGGLDAATLLHTDPATHPGFQEEVLAFHSSTNRWIAIGTMPEGASRVTAPTAFWNGQWVIPNGEKGPGIRSNRVVTLDVKNPFGWVNWTTLGVYLVLMMGIGLYYSKRENTTNDYFLAGGRIPWWAAGLSIYGTQLSAITFMAIPAIVYATDWRLAIGSLMIFAIVPVIIKYYLPFFRRLNITTAYEYLELRFNLRVRLLGSITFILLQLARMGVVVYLPAIAIASVTGMNILLCIAIMGAFSTAYTVMGGIEAVIWTDVIQVLVLLGGALLALFIALENIDGGFSKVYEMGMEHQKFKLFEWSWDFTEFVFWVGIVGFFFLNLISYTSDQVVIQRYLTVRNEDEAAKSIWTNGVITIPGIFVFFGLGTVLYVYYLTNPEKVGATNPEELLPYFVVAELPLGAAGLVIAGIFAASMSSLDSSMNSIATAYITDIHKHYWAGWEDIRYLGLAKIVTVVTGLFGTLTAMWIAVSEVGFIFELFQRLLGMIGGCLAGVFILAIFSRKANATGVIIGIVSGAVITFLVSRFTDVHGYLYGAIGVLTCTIIGYFSSRAFPYGQGQPEGYTYKTLVKKTKNK
ncbi:MAG TPA: sodium/solute symporter, partial [Cyclobacteriaceae bacterium]|nr:sodium/solute symporter [Cyclobacteriaceae bacterium]